MELLSLFDRLYINERLYYYYCYFRYAFIKIYISDVTL